MTVRILVTLDKEEGRFFGGELIEGVVNLSVTQATKISGLRVKLLRQDGNSSRTRSILSLMWIPIEETLQPGVDPLNIPISIPTRGDNSGSYQRNEDNSHSIHFIIRTSVHTPSIIASKTKSCCFSEREIQLIPLLDANLGSSLVPIHSTTRKPQRIFGIFQRGSVSANLAVGKKAFIHGEHLSVSISITNNSSLVNIGFISALIIEAIVQPNGKHKRIKQRTIIDSGNILLLQAEAVQIIRNNGIFNHTLEFDLPHNQELLSPDIKCPSFFIEHFVDLIINNGQNANSSNVLKLKSQFIVATTHGLPPNVRPRSVSSPLSNIDLINNGIIQQQHQQHQQQISSPLTKSKEVIEVSVVENNNSDIPSTSNPQNYQQNVLNASQRGYCVVCQESKASFAIVPCGHRVLCQICSDVVINSKQACPICRQPINSVIHVFDS